MNGGQKTEEENERKSMIWWFQTAESKQKRKYKGESKIKMKLN